MAALVRKLLLRPRDDGLLVQPVSSRDTGTPSLKISYGDNHITELARDESNVKEAKTLEAYGIVGLLNLVTCSYLIVISRRERVALIHAQPVYALRDVAIIPLSSQPETEQAISIARTTLKQHTNFAADDEEASDAGEENDMGTHNSDEVTTALDPPSTALEKGTSFVRDVVQDRGRYGRFTERWFSKAGWNTSRRRSVGMTSGGNLIKEQEEQTLETVEGTAFDAETVGNDNQASGDNVRTAQAGSKPASSAHPSKSVLDTLTPRILHATRLYFRNSGFYYSYEHDLSSTLMQQDLATPSVPLWKRFREEYFWNRHLQVPFINAGQNPYILPLFQGFVGQRAFSIARTDLAEQDLLAESGQEPEELVMGQEAASPPGNDGTSSETTDFLLTLISRRSVDRAGLRYLRRGVDNEGNVANAVETEQILSPMTWDPSAKTFSLVQFRGSIPLFFSQTPYSFKPEPVLFGSESTNRSALKSHFDKLTRRYDSVQCVCLVDKHGTEARIGKEFERHVQTQISEFNSSRTPVGFEWFDFHSECRGMKFENVMKLLETLKSTLASYGWFIKQNHLSVRRQRGVLRTNCMDCLDRTNVVQSAVAGWALEQQLHELGLEIDLKADMKTRWFNTLWADNGDAISKQYAGTPALKGDFTRSRKRNWTGALADLTLTLNRYYNNIFGDYFLQLIIDYLLGKVSPGAFDDFEADMIGRDYALDVNEIRQNAIDTCSSVVHEEDEDLLGGWAVSCPHEAETLRTLPFEDCVLLLTDKALYHCRFDWDAEKVGIFERVDLTAITDVWRGAYVTSTLAPIYMDESKHVGFALKYHPRDRNELRGSTRSVDNEISADQANQASIADPNHDDKATGHEVSLLAFKALPSTSPAAKQGNDDVATSNERELIDQICNQLQQAMTTASRKVKGVDHLELDKTPQVEERAVISAADARKNTSYMESIGYSMKKLVWGQAS